VSGVQRGVRDVEPAAAASRAAAGDVRPHVGGAAHAAVVLVGLWWVLVSYLGSSWVCRVLVGLSSCHGFRGTAVVLVGLSWVLVRLE